MKEKYIYSKIFLKNKPKDFERFKNHKPNVESIKAINKFPKIKFKNLDKMRAKSPKIIR